MSDLQYKIVLTGFINERADRGKVVDGLQATFKVNSDKAEALLSGSPSVIKKNIDRVTAQRYFRVIDKLGAKVAIEPMNGAIETPGKNIRAPKRRLATPKQTRSVRTQPGYPFKIEGDPDYSFVTVRIPANETLKVEASAMATMDPNVSMVAKWRGGLKRFVTRGSNFINEFTANEAPGEIGIAPAAPGDLDHIYLNNKTVYLQNSAYVASTHEVEVETTWQGLAKGFFTGDSLFLMRCHGRGDLWFSSYGGLVNIDVNGGYVVDTGNVVAFTEGLKYSITKVGGYKSLFFSGEGFVCRFSGKGKVWIQTRKVRAFASWLMPFRPMKGKG